MFSDQYHYDAFPSIFQATAATLETLMMTNLDTQMGTAAGTVTATMADGGKKASKAFGNGN